MTTSVARVIKQKGVEASAIGSRAASGLNKIETKT